MFDEVVRDELDDGWEVVDGDVDPLTGSTDDDLGGEITSDDLDTDVESDPGDGVTIGCHESGAQIHVDAVDGTRLVNVTQEVESDGFVAHPATHSQAFGADHVATGYVREVGEKISDGEDQMAAFAIVAHAGSVDSIDLSSLDDHNATSERGMADVFVVRPEQLPDRMGVEDLYESRRPLIELVYGLRQDIPDVMETVSSKQEAYGSATIEVLTVSKPHDLEFIGDSDA